MFSSSDESAAAGSELCTLCQRLSSCSKSWACKIPGMLQIPGRPPKGCAGSWGDPGAQAAWHLQVLPPLSKAVQHHLLLLPTNRTRELVSQDPLASIPAFPCHFQAIWEIIIALNWIVHELLSLSGISVREKVRKSICETRSICGAPSTALCWDHFWECLGKRFTFPSGTHSRCLLPILYFTTRTGESIWLNLLSKRQTAFISTEYIPRYSRVIRTTFPNQKHNSS